MAFIFNLSTFELNQSLFRALGGAAAARTVGIAAAARNSGPRKVKERSNLARLEAQAREAQRTLEGYSKLKVKQKRAVSTLEKANERLELMKSIMLEARELIVLAQSPDATPEGQRDLANLFDQLIGKYNLRAKGAGFAGTNLIGASIRDIFDANDLEVQSKPGSLVNTVYNGTFLGSDYVITDGSGNTFLPNIFSSSLVQFPNSDPNDTGVLLKNDDIIVFDSATGAISITRNGDATPILEGTLERKGVGVLGSYFYGNFQDSAKLDEALDDITSALSSLRFNISTFGVQLKRAEVLLKFSENKIDINRNVITSLEADKFAAERRFTLEEQKRQFIFESAIQTSLNYNSRGIPSILQSAFFDFET